jgi:hypothetical protein
MADEIVETDAPARIDRVTVIKERRSGGGMMLAMVALVAIAAIAFWAIGSNGKPDTGEVSIAAAADKVGAAADKIGSAAEDAVKKID